jgi:hypothetical protein
VVRRAELIACVGAATLAVPSSALACSCLRRTESARYRGAAAAFVGRLVKIRVLPGQDPGLGSKQADYRFRVKHAYKRHLRRYVVVRSSTSDAACGLAGRKGHLYALYLSRSRHRWYTNACSLTSARALARAAKRAKAHASVAPPVAVHCLS